MGEPDSATKIYVRRNDVVADVVNQYVYHGRQVIAPAQLSELDTTSLARTKQGNAPATMTEKDIMKFRTNMREILQLLRCANDKDKFQQAIDKHARFRSVDREAVDVINATTQADLKYSKDKETIDMCKAMKDIRAESRAEGRAEGKAEGRTEGKAEGRAEGRAEGKTEARLENIKSIMKKMNLTAQQAMDLLDIPKQSRSSILAML